MNKNKIKKLLKNKRFVIVTILVLIGIICLILLKNILSPNGNISTYGNRLDGIKKIEFSKTDKEKIITELEKNEKVSSAKINVHGKIINVIFNVVKDTTVDDSKAIANESINNFSDKVKNFYDIQYIITMNDEVGTKETIQNEDGTTKKKEIKIYPKMGYKNSSSEGIVW